MANSIHIHVHSFVDLITNSSSETFITATESTLTSIKQLVNSILAAGGSDKKFDDLFTAKTVYMFRHYDATGYDWKEFSSSDEVDTFCDENDISRYDEGSANRIDVVITAIDPQNVVAERLINQIDTFFDSVEVYS